MPTLISFTRICVLMITALAMVAILAEGAEISTLVDGNTAFALRLYGQVRLTEGNLVLSPYSLSSALAMTFGGARGETARQMEQTLHFEQSTTNLHPLFGRLNKALEVAQGSNELCIANSLWPQKEYPFRQEFLTLLRNDYGATVTSLNYEHQAEQARVTINEWVGDKTRHKIAKLIGPGVLDGSTRMVLVNAIYFKGTWATPFAETATQPDKFYSNLDTATDVPFMYTGGRFKYGETDQLQMLALPYAGQKLEMIILLPRSRDGIRQLENNLNPARLASWLAKAADQDVNVALPKFKMSTGFNLRQTLQAIGMIDAFGADADFSGMDGKLRWLYLSAVLHKAYIDVNEKGTEAAAATADVMEAGGPSPATELSREFRADHPFMFLIRDTTTGSILFMGRVYQPGSD